jgi:uncharacterized OB-fold protein
MIAETLSATQCTCGAVYLPPKKRCIRCRSETVPVELKNTGKLITYTVLNTPPEGFTPPVILGLIELDSSNETSNTLNSPKLLCGGKLSSSELEMGLPVVIRQENDKYYFTKSV